MLDEVLAFVGLDRHDATNAAAYVGKPVVPSGMPGGKAITGRARHYIAFDLVVPAIEAQRLLWLGKDY
jgi:hypothetical protein